MGKGIRAYILIQEWKAKDRRPYHIPGKRGTSPVYNGDHQLTIPKAAVDVMQKHGSDLADRPRTVAAGEICSGDMRTLLVGAGERLKKLRRFAQKSSGWSGDRLNLMLATGLCILNCKLQPRGSMRPCSIGTRRTIFEMY